MKYPNNDNGRDRQLMEAGDLAPLIAEFTRQLSQEGYADLTVRGYDDAARHLAHWLANPRSRPPRSTRLS
jgi:integrase/recombinase XerD